ncbi:MAG: hypothetical protein ACYCWE_09610 [Eubacteriales bacterium]
MIVKINGVTYETSRDFSLSEQAGNKTASTIIVKVGAVQTVPHAGDIITVLDESDNVIFWGTCGIPASPKFNTGHEALIYQIICGNANTICSYRVINEAFTDYTVTQIVTALFNQYVAEEGITLGEISSIPLEIDVYTAQDMNLQDAFNELADLVNAVWRIGNDKKFYFIVREDFPVFPETIDINFMVTDIQHTEKDYKTRTVQYISGAADTTSPQTETFTYEAQQSFDVNFPISAKPTMKKNGVAVDPAIIGVNGLSNDNPAIVFMFSYNSVSVVYKSESMYLTADDVVEITYTGLFPIRLSASNDTKIAEIAALTGTSGKREIVDSASNVKTYNDAATLAASLLSQYSEATGELRFWLPSDMLYGKGYTLNNVDLLTVIPFNLPTLNITGDYIIVERTLTPMKADLDNIAEKLKISLRLVNRDFIKPYGEIISALQRKVSKLTFREDDTVISMRSISESLAVTESVITGYDIPYFPLDAVANGSLFSPATLTENVYPT